MKILYQLCFPGIKQQKATNNLPFYVYLMDSHFHYNETNISRVISIAFNYYYLKQQNTWKRFNNT